MKSFLCKCILVVLIVATVDFVFGILYQHIIQALPNAGLSQTDTYYAVTSEEAEILILGASNAKRGYDPNIFYKHGYTKVYNAGLDGNEMAYHLTVLKCFLQRCTPRIVLLDLNESSIDGTWLNRLKMHMFMYKENPLIKEMILKYDNVDYLDIKSLSSLYRYNCTLPWILRAFMLGPAKIDKKGFSPLLDRKSENLDLQHSYWNGKVDENEMRALREIVYLCKLNNIQLYVCISPTYKIHDGGFSKYIKNVLREKGIPVWDYSNNKHFLNNKQYFYDANHLNSLGADKYTELIVENITSVS